MESLLDWMKHGSPCYDPNRIGAVSMAKVLSALTAAGKIVLTPSLWVRPYDFVIDDEGSFYRVQCKTGRMFRGAVYFRPHRLRAARRDTGWQRRTTSYRGEVDYFGVYCPENESVYLVPIDDVSCTRVCSLRMTPPKNNQAKRIRWAEQYLVVPKPIPLGTSLDDLIFD